MSRKYHKRAGRRAGGPEYEPGPVTVTLYDRGQPTIQVAGLVPKPAKSGKLKRLNRKERNRKRDAYRTFLGYVV